jgi:hypothetical protein
LWAAFKDEEYPSYTIFVDAEDVRAQCTADIPHQTSMITRLSSNMNTIFVLGESAVVFELWRMVEENEVLRKTNAQYEADVQKLIYTSQLGHQNAKQKLQYHLRYQKPTPTSR